MLVEFMHRLYNYIYVYVYTHRESLEGQQRGLNKMLKDLRKDNAELAERCLTMMAESSELEGRCVHVRMCMCIHVFVFVYIDVYMHTLICCVVRRSV